MYRATDPPEIVVTRHADRIHHPSADALLRYLPEFLLRLLASVLHATAARAA